MFQSKQKSKKASKPSTTTTTPHTTTRRTNTTTTTTSSSAQRTSKRRAVQPLSLDESVSRRLNPAPDSTSPSRSTRQQSRQFDNTTQTPSQLAKAKHNPKTDSTTLPPAGVLPAKPLYDAFLGPSSPAALSHSFNPDLSKAQMYEMSTHRFKKINQLDLSHSPTSVTHQQMLNRNWGIQNVLSFLRTQKVADMVVFDTSGQSVTCDYTIMCSVTSTKPMQALTSKIVALGRMNKAVGYERFSAGDDPDGLWNVATLGHIVVHVLTPAGRSSPMVQRVERRLLIDAKLIPVNEWDDLVDPWVRQSQELWDATEAGKVLGWEDKKVAVHDQKQAAQLFGQPPPPGYYLRVNPKAISPTYDQTSEEDDYNYLDLNEQHMNKLEFMKHLGYDDMDVQLDPEIIGKQMMGTIDLMPVADNQGEGMTNLHTPGARKRTNTGEDGEDYDVDGEEEFGDDVDFLKDLENGQGDEDAIPVAQDENAPAHLTQAKKSKATGAAPTTPKGTKAPKATTGAKKSTTTKTTKSKFSTLAPRNRTTTTPLTSQSPSTRHHYNQQQRRSFVSETDFSTSTTTATNNQLYNNFTPDLSGRDISHNPRRPTPIRHTSSSFHPTPTSSFHTYRSPLDLNSHLDDPGPLLGFDLMLLGAQPTNTASSSSKGYGMGNKTAETSSDFDFGSHSDIEMSTSLHLTPNHLRPRHIRLQSPHHLFGGAGNGNHSDNQKEGMDVGGGLSGTEWFEELGDITTESPNYSKCHFRQFDSLDNLANMPSQKSSGVISDLMHQQHLDAGDDDEHSSPTQIHMTQRASFADIDDDFFTQSLGGRNNGLSHNARLFRAANGTLSPTGNPFDEDDLYIEEEEDELGMFGNHRGNNHTITMINHHDLDNGADNYETQFDLDSHLADALADHRENMSPGLELDADDDADLQRFSSLLTTQRHRSLHQQQLVSNQMQHMNHSWSDDDYDDDDEQDIDNDGDNNNTNETRTTVIFTSKQQHQL